MLANSHTGLVNTENGGSASKLWSYVNHDDDDDNEDAAAADGATSSSSRKRRIQQEEEENDETRQRSRIPPSTGAFSYLQGLSFIAREDLEAGHEIFVDYGDHVRIQNHFFLFVDRRNLLPHGSNLDPSSF
jgi:hypothetical protein